MQREMVNSYEVSVEKPQGRDCFRDLGIDESIILNWILNKTGCECVNWIHLALDRVQWWSVLVM
jgi:hypothetical protein